VTVALLGLLVADLASIRGLGPVGAAGILLALPAMLTVLPALLVLVGRRAFWPFIPRYGSDSPEGSAVFARLGQWIASRPRFIWVGTSIALAILALGLTGTTIGGNTTADFRVSVDSVTGQRLLATSYPAGASEATQVIVRPAGQVQLARRAALSTPGVARVGSIERSGNLARFDVTLAADPAGNGALSTISLVRERIHAAVPGALVGRPMAQQLDTRTAALRDSIVIVPLVLVTVLIVLGLPLRAAMAPVLLLATVVLSCSAAFGVSVVVFQYLLLYMAGLLTVLAAGVWI
jgi:putative drug exporter of the RND superfamily